MFLSKAAALKEYIKSDYITHMGPDELQRRIIRNNAGDTMLECYANKIREFNQKEMKCILLQVSKISNSSVKNNIININISELLPTRSVVKFIKLDHGIDWDSPYTINHCIVLPQKIVDDMMSVDRTKTLLHEFIHILQRYPDLYPEINKKFNSYYRSLNFYPVIGRLRFEVSKDFFKLASNPDAMNNQWVWRYKNKTYLIMFGEDDKGEMCGGIAEVNNGVVSSNWNYLKNKNVEFYTNQIPDEQNYHPYEILASRVSRTFDF